MYILPIYTQKQPQIYRSSNFKSAQTQPARLSLPCSSKVNSILRAYKDIMDRLAQKTPEGIKFIEEHFPNVSIKDCLIFHNCGDKKSSILIRMAESLKYNGLTHIIERQSNTSWGNRIVKNSFLLEGEDRLLKTENENNPYFYPQKQEYYSDEEVKCLNLENNLSNILNNLDFSMLKFRIFLDKHDKDFLLPPVGKLPKEILEKFSGIESLTQKVNSILESLPKKVSLEACHSFKDYKLTSGTSSHFFQNLGDKNLTINYHKMESSKEENLKRLSVFDNTGKLIQTFVVTGDGKMVKNLNQNFEAALPRKLSFVNTDEIKEEKFSQNFKDYLELYYKKLVSFNKHLENIIKIRYQQNNRVPQGLSENEQTLLNNIETCYQEIQEKIQKLDPTSSAELKKTVTDLYAPAGRKGITFDGFENNKRIYLLPIKSKTHSGLTRLTITEANGTETMYLIKDNKYIVKNFNPKYPQIIPPTLIYANELDEIDDLTEALEFFNKRITDYKEHVDFSIQNKPEPKKRGRCKKIKNQEGEYPQNWNQKQVELLKFCKSKISEMNNNIKNPVDLFNKTVIELQEKLTEYLESRK